MKNLKKFAALLLAGAMALLMLTACGGGGEVGERVPEAESNLFGKYATSSQASNIKENNKSLQAIADGYLQKDLNTDQHLWHETGRRRPCGRRGRPLSHCYRNGKLHWRPAE